jgi:hypothetical protein
MAYSDTSSSSSSNASSSDRQEQRVVLAKIFIIKIDPETDSIVSIESWDGTEPEEGSMLLAYGVKISDNTFDAYTPITDIIRKKLALLEKHKSYHRTASPKRSFKHMIGELPSGDSFSCLYGNPYKRKMDPYQPTSVYETDEKLQDLLLISLMTKRSRHAWRRDDFKIYASRKLRTDGRPKSCWYLVNGQDVWDEGSPYIKKVKESKISLSDACDIKKDYCVLHDFTVSNVQDLLFHRELHKYSHIGRPRKRPRMDSSSNKDHEYKFKYESPSIPSKRGGKSRRIVKLRFKKKTIKRRK